MRLYDISQEVFSCKVYPGDPKPKGEALCSMEAGDLYNLTAFSMCAHNGTHLDAPKHFLKDGKTVDEIPLSKTVGAAYVAVCEGELDAAGAEDVLKKAALDGKDTQKRILLKGNVTVTCEAAKVFAKAQIDLLGVELQTVGDESAPMAAHLALLAKEVVLLEGIRLEAVREGAYFLCAQPLNLSGSDGAPVRAVLIDFSQDA